MHNRNIEVNVLFNKHSVHNSIIAIVVALLFLLSPVVLATMTDSAYAAPEDYSDPEIGAVAAMLVEADSGQVLFEKEPDMRRAPASTTKIMTALLAIESLGPDTMVTIDSEVEAVEESQIFLQEGEEISVRDLLYGTLITSANDAAVALAKEVSGSESAFVEKMNARAALLGLDSTNFENANGLDGENHYSTARDMAKLAVEAMKNDIFKEYVSTSEYTIPATNMYDERSIQNTNLLLHDSESFVDVFGESRPIKYDGTVGVKTGFTDIAGRCLVAKVERDGVDLVSVIMGAESYGNSVFQDTLTLFEYGYNFFDPIPVFGDDNSQIEVAVIKGKPKNVVAGPARELDMLVSKDMPGKIRYDFEVADDVEAPIAKGETVGKIRAYSDEVLLGEVDLVALADVKRRFSLLSLFGGDKKKEAPSEESSEESGEEAGEEQNDETEPAPEESEGDDASADVADESSDEPKETSSSNPASVIIKIIVAIIIVVVGFFIYIVIKHNNEVLARRRRRRMKWGSSYNTREIKRVKRLK